MWQISGIYISYINLHIILLVNHRPHSWLLIQLSTSPLNRWLVWLESSNTVSHTHTLLEPRRSENQINLYYSLLPCHAPHRTKILSPHALYLVKSVILDDGYAVCCYPIPGAALWMLYRVSCDVFFFADCFISHLFGDVCMVCLDVCLWGSFFAWCRLFSCLLLAWLPLWNHLKTDLEKYLNHLNSLL